MPNSDLLPSLLYKLNENQLALEATIMELSNWVEQHGSAEVADNVRAPWKPSTRMKNSSDDARGDDGTGVTEQFSALRDKQQSTEDNCQRSIMFRAVTA